jgi:hypothetical protein
VIEQETSTGAREGNEMRALVVYESMFGGIRP